MQQLLAAASRPKATLHSFRHKAERLRYVHWRSQSPFKSRY